MPLQRLPHALGPLVHLGSTSANGLGFVLEIPQSPAVWRATAVASASLASSITMPGLRPAHRRLAGGGADAPPGWQPSGEVPLGKYPARISVPVTGRAASCTIRKIQNGSLLHVAPVLPVPRTERK